MLPADAVAGLRDEHSRRASAPERERGGQAGDARADDDDVVDGVGGDADDQPARGGPGGGRPRGALDVDAARLWRRPRSTRG